MRVVIGIASGVLAVVLYVGIVIYAIKNIRQCPSNHEPEEGDIMTASHADILRGQMDD